MTVEEVYNSVAYYIKDDVGYPCNYSNLSTQQRLFVDSFTEEIDRNEDEKIFELKSLIEDLEYEVSTLTEQLEAGLGR